MSSSRRIRLGSTTDNRRPPAKPAPGVAARLATFTLLLAGGIVALLFLVRLGALVCGWDVSPLGYLQEHVGQGARSILLAGAVVALALLIRLVVRRDEEMLWFAALGADGRGGGVAGGVLLPAAVLRRYLETSAAGCHPDVLRVELRVGVRGGRVFARARVFARPLADVDAVARPVDERLRTDVLRLTGREPSSLRTDVRVLTARRLKRHLP